MQFLQIKKIPVAFMLLALPASTNYEMKDVGFGAGGLGISESSNYGMTGMAGEVSGTEMTSSNYDLGPGLVFTQQANTPGAPTFTNPANHYNKLQFIINTGNNPSDATFVIAVSTDDFVTTNYVQTDGTIGAVPVYQTYSDWGGAGGEFMIGLASSTTYKIKVKAIHTKYTETEFSVTSYASTVSPTLSYDLDVSSSDSESASPYIVAFGTLSVGSVTTTTDKVWVDFDTNAESGGFIYTYANNSGLVSANAGYTITSSTINLGGTNEGYGIRVDSATQTSGGPLTAVSPYNGVAENIGVIDTTSRTIFTSTGPIIDGRGSVLVKAKADAQTPAATDYTSIITMIASATF